MAQPHAINISAADMERVHFMLAGIKNAPERVITRSLNKTLAGVKTDASAEIRKTLNVKKAEVDKTFRIGKATAANLTASIMTTGAPLPLGSFLNSRQTKTGVSVVIKKDRGRKILRRTFKARTKSGHAGIFERDYRQAAAPGTPAKIPYAKLPKKYRLPISEKFGPRVPDIMENEPVMNTVLAQAGRRLQKNLKHELDYELSTLK
ncbi:MAG: phage tail protein [Desulfococcus multivorans]|jgi:hypothetical protein|nr:phage tail protein [Desulfococcus multivorans]